MKLQDGQLWRNKTGRVVEIQYRIGLDDETYPFRSITIDGEANDYYIYDVNGMNYGGDNPLVKFIGIPQWSQNKLIDFNRPIRNIVTRLPYTFLIQSSNGTVVVEDPVNLMVLRLTEHQIENFNDEPRSATNEIVLAVDTRTGDVSNCINGYAEMMDWTIIGRKTITVTEGEGMNGGELK